MSKLEVTNPQSGERLAVLEKASLEEIVSLVAGAKEAQKEWGRKSMYARSQVLYRFLELYRERAEEIAKIISLEMGKTKKESLEEVEKTAVNIRGTIERANHLYGQVLPDSDPDYEEDLVFTKRVPIGLIGCIIPFNYPVELTIWKVIPALLMGNALVVKAPSSNPLAVLKIREILVEAGVPEAVIPFIVCDRGDCTEGIIKNPKVDALTLTGSTAAGIQMAENSAKFLKPLFLELGGNDPFIICHDADIHLAVEEMVSGRMCNAGQTCCAPKRFLVDRRIEKKLTAVLEERLSKIKVGNAWDDHTELATLVTEQAAEGVEAQVHQTIEEGAEVVCGSRRKGAYYAPTVLAKVTRDMEIARDLEIFGPVFPIIAFDTEEEAIEIANQSSYALNAGVLAGDTMRAMRIAAQVDAGSIVVNGHGLFRHMDQAHGGPKMSGLGREGISCSLEEFSEVKNYILKGAFRVI